MMTYMEEKNSSDSDQDVFFCPAILNSKTLS